jgi:hypothetical protein
MSRATVLSAKIGGVEAEFDAKRAELMPDLLEYKAGRMFATSTILRFAALRHATPADARRPSLASAPQVA